MVELSTFAVDQTFRAQTKNERSDGHVCDAGEGVFSEKKQPVQDHHLCVDGMLSQVVCNGRKT